MFGAPLQDDGLINTRRDYTSAEPTIEYNAGAVGAMAALADFYNSGPYTGVEQLEGVIPFACMGPTPAPAPAPAPTLLLSPVPGAGPDAAAVPPTDAGTPPPAGALSAAGTASLGVLPALAVLALCC